MRLEQSAGVNTVQGTSSQEPEGSFWKPSLAIMGTLPVWPAHPSRFWNGCLWPSGACLWRASRNVWRGNGTYTAQLPLPGAGHMGAGRGSPLLPLPPEAAESGLQQVWPALAGLGLAHVSPSHSETLKGLVESDGTEQSHCSRTRDCKN